MDPKLPLSSLAKSIMVGGSYEHYKGLRYKVLAVAHHSETLEELVGHLVWGWRFRLLESSRGCEMSLGVVLN